MQLSLTSTQLFIFPDASLVGRMRGGVLSSEARMVGQRTRATESQAKKWTFSQRPLFLNFTLRPPTQHPLWQHLKMWIPELHPDFLNWGVAQKFAFLTSTPGNSSADCSLSTTATDSVDPGRWWADLGLSERLLILSEEGSCLITQPFMKHLHTVRTMCHALF